MSCENLVIPKPLTGQCPTTLFGIPYGTAGRTVAGQTFPIAGIVLHCYDGTIGELCNEMKCRTRSSVISGSWENSFHYGIGASGSSGGFLQFVEDNNISWSFGTYKNNTYATVPPPNVAINWPTLQGEHGINTTPNVYTIDIALAIGHIVDATQPGGCYDCPTASGLQQTQHDMLVQMLAYLAQEYGIPIDAEHITFHDLIHCGEGVECPCTDIETLLAEVAAFCPPCEEEALSLPVAESNDDIQYIYGVTEPCCPGSPGCLNLIPWDACFIGDLAVDGTLDSYILGLSQNQAGQWCLTRGCLAVTSPIIGCGTVDDPLRLDLCAFGTWLPDDAAANAVGLVAIDGQGCAIEVPACELVTECETDITVIDTDCIDLTSSGVNGHTLQADIILSPDVGNQIECRANGLFGMIDCDNIKDIFQTVSVIDWLPGVDDQGNCVQESVFDMFERLFSIQDTNCIDLTWNNNVLSIAPIIAPEPQGDVDENNLFCLQDGLFVPKLQILDGFTINLGLGGSYDHILSSDIIFSQNPENLASVDFTPGTGGLLVVFNANDTDCINLDLTTGTLTATPVISPTIGGVTNVLACMQTGLYVPRGADANVNGPIVGDGSDVNPLDIDFTLLDAQDFCDLGDTISVGVLTDLVGIDQANCLKKEAVSDVLASALTAQDTNCISLDFTAGILTSAPIISPAVDNIITCTAQGLYVPAPTISSVTNTNCINLDDTGGVLSATPVIDPQGDNELVCGLNGLYVQTGAGLQVVDTNCMNLTLVGGVLSATPILAGTQAGVPNIIDCIAGQGLYVPEGGGLTVQNGDCTTIDLTNAVLRVDVDVDPTGDNQLTCIPAGLYVPPLAGLLVDDTDCISLDITGETLTASPILAPAQAGVTNVLTCIAGQGLYVPGIVAADLVTVQDTDCIDLTLTPSGVLSADPIIDPDPCNGLECRANGLYVENDYDDQVIESGLSINSINLPVTPLTELLPNAAPGDPQQAPGEIPLSFSITNQSLCHPMNVVLAIDPQSVNVINGTAATKTLNHQLQYDLDNGGGWVAESGNDFTRVIPSGAFDEFIAAKGANRVIIIPAGATRTIRVRRLIWADIDGNPPFNAGTLILDSIIATLNGTSLV